MYDCSSAATAMLLNLAGRWLEVLAHGAEDHNSSIRPMRAHLAVLYAEYLSKVLAGEKTVEGRFSKVRCAPHGMVSAGDRVFLKEQSGPVMALADVAQVLTFENLSRCQAELLIAQYGARLCIGEDFVPRVISARYITLMRLARVTLLPPMWLDKRDRRPWVVLSPQRSFFGRDQWQQALWSVLAGL